MTGRQSSQQSIKHPAIALPALLLASVMATAYGQLLHPKEPMPSFELASIRPWQSNPSPVQPTDGSSRPKIQKVVPVGTASPVNDRIHFIGQVELLIESAYGLPFDSDNRVIGGPDWIRKESDRYEITGKIDDTQYLTMQKLNASEQQQQVSLMEQSLLAERFELKVHFETRQMHRYALVAAKGGSKLSPAEDGATSQLSFVRNGPEYEVKAVAIRLSDFVKSPVVKADKREVVDKTNLPGKFNFTLRFKADDDNAASENTDAPGLITALQEQLGLKLIPEGGPVEVVVIDHIERPTSN